MLKKYGDRIINIPRKSSTYSSSHGIVGDSGFIYTALIFTDGSNNVELTLYNAELETNLTVVSGTTPTKLLPAFTVDGADNYDIINIPYTAFDDGLYVDVVTSGTCEYIIYYDNN